jgi:uncharacterized protein
LNGVKITLDGDRDTHNRMRPLRGRQGTFDRIIENVRDVADLVPITIGGNFDESSVDSYPTPARLPERAGVRGQDRQDQLQSESSKGAHHSKGIIPLTVVSGDDKPLNGTCMTSAGAGKLPGVGGSMCDSCHFVDEKMANLRDETRRRGFPTPDGVPHGAV